MPGNSLKELHAVILPQPRTRFGRTAARLDALSAGHTMGDWLRFMGGLSRAQHCIAEVLGPAEGPDLALPEQAAEAGLPPLAPDRWAWTAQWRDALRAEHLLAASGEPSTPDLIVAMYGHLALSPALLVGVSLADAVGDRRTQNIPGTSDEYPNWRIPLCDGEGKAMLIEELAGCELVKAVVTAATAGLSAPGS